MTDQGDHCKLPAAQPNVSARAAPRLADSAPPEVVAYNPGRFAASQSPPVGVAIGAIIPEATFAPRPAR
jgi:hypothetical protein